MSVEAECPVCSAYIPIDPLEVTPGQIIYCSFCMAKLMITREMLEGEEGKTKKVELEENWD